MRPEGDDDFELDDEEKLDESTTLRVQSFRERKRHAKHVFIRPRINMPRKTLAQRKSHMIQKFKETFGVRGKQGFG